MSEAFDTALIVSGDSDLAPAITAVKKLHPQKRIGVVIPIGRKAEFLKRITDFHQKIKRKHLLSSLMESPVQLPDGTQLNSPYLPEASGAFSEEIEAGRGGET